ncbi:YfcL family protein [Colwellia piezophila]|uniref:YfcL family protein n=1 Tax=Colwellia piezophila TaxID=211668 RepID=UPI0003643919|nr:YfcL family protein [Colwellia piezophila]
MTTDKNISDISTKKLTTVADFYQYLDALFELDMDSDTLFAGSYLRCFISLVATEYGDENQVIATPLLTDITAKVSQGKTELSPQDHAIVTNFWLGLQQRVVL